MITDRHIEIIKECLPYLEINKWQLRRLDDNKCKYFEYCDNDKLVGFSVVRDSMILFIGVIKDYRCKGIGSSLLKQSEEYIKEKGYKNVRLAGLTIGVPTNRSEFGYTYDLNSLYKELDDKAHTFFKNKGYVSSWIDEDPFDMEMDFKDKDDVLDKYHIDMEINSYFYRRAKREELEKVKESVGSASKEFVKFYDSEYYFENDDAIILECVDKDCNIAGALLVSTHNKDKGVGSIGCMAVSPKYRHQGIATNLSLIGTSYLKSLGLKKAFLSFTHSGLERIYEKAGYRINIIYFMGIKNLLK